MPRQFILPVSILLILALAHDGFAAGKRKRGGGPAPYGYFRCAGEAVPDWSPATARQRAVGARLEWTFLGARPISNEGWSAGDGSGRVVNIAVHPTDPNTVYAAAASGGLWKTTNGGVNWEPITDHLSNLNSGAVAIDPTNPETIYYGTGEWQTGAAGDGLFKSTDGGASWEKIASTDQVGSTIARIVVNPADPLIVHVAGGGGHTRSTDGGVTWSGRQLSNTPDLVIDPSNPAVLYCARYSWGIYKSTNNGLNWTRLTNGLYTNTNGIGRVNLAICASNPQVLYLALLKRDSHLRGFYKTTDGGANWTQLLNTPDYPNGQGWYDHFVGCDPANPDVVYGGGVWPYGTGYYGVVKSTDGGNSWTDITVGTQGGQLHPDQHHIAFGPDGTVWIGNDGGVWKSTNGGATWINCNSTLAVTQNYQIALHPTDPNRLMGGTQDVGTNRRVADELVWPQLIAGDGGFLAYDFVQPIRSYTTYVNLTIWRFIGGSFNGEITGPWGSDPRGFIAPLVMDPNNSNSLLGGTNRVWRTTNASASNAANVVWTAISDSSVGGGGVLNAIAVALGNSNIIYTGSTNGRVFFTDNAVNWLDRSAGVPAGPAVSDIVIDPQDPQHAFLSSYATSGGRVFETHDAGQTWTSVTGNLPAGLSARALAVDWLQHTPGLYIGTGVGVYASYDGGANWVKENVNLPNVNIGDLAVDVAFRTLTAGTYGRGAWRSPLPCLSGDLDGDLVVDSDDIPPFIGVLLTGDATPDEACAADVNTDGEINGVDTQRFVDILVAP